MKGDEYESQPTMTKTEQNDDDQEWETTRLVGLKPCRPGLRAGPIRPGLIRAAAAHGYENLLAAILTHVDEEDRASLQNLGGHETRPLTNPNEGGSSYILGMPRFAA